ncbi:MAG TPA: Gfo/Idh/MocA family oxidoreductase [Solirubrobacterales bacterium]|nr:Gfo/Idh/MocA family oxidoreductase [Solirubrobacterales bacterium]
MRLGIAGCGRIAERGYLPAAEAAEGVTIVAFADPNPDRLDGCLAPWRAGGGEAQGHASLAELLAAEPIDLLVVAAPLDLHVPLAEEAAATGVRSLVEKPPAPDLAGALRLAELEPEPVLAFNRRFLQGLELRDSIPAEGWIELDLELRFQQGSWGAHEVRDEALLDAGIHLVDLACHLSGAAPIAVRQAQITPRRARFELELSRGRARIECATDRRHRETVSVRDRSGRVLSSWAWGGLRSRLGGLTGKPDPLVTSIQRQLEEATKVPLLEQRMGRLQQGHLRGLACARDGVIAMAVVEAARRSAELGGAEVTVAPVAGVPA